MITIHCSQAIDRTFPQRHLFETEKKRKSENLSKTLPKHPLTPITGYRFKINTHELFNPKKICILYILPRELLGDLVFQSTIQKQKEGERNDKNIPSRFIANDTLRVPF